MYETEHGNTDLIAIGEALSEQGDVLVTPVGRFPGADDKEPGLLIYEASTQRHGLTASSRVFLGSPTVSLGNVPALAFDTGYRGTRWMRGLAAAEGFWVDWEEGPLELGEEHRSRGWALKAPGQTGHATVREERTKR